MAEINYLEESLSTGVKFYASLTRAQAKGEVPIKLDKDGKNVYVEPGAVCFVADSKGNSIFLNKRLFGDGAVSSGGSGGSTVTEVSLSGIDVVIESDGTVLKTLADYFKADGTVVTDKLVVYSIKEDSTKEEAVKIDKTGVYFYNLKLATESFVTSTVSANNLSIIDSAVEAVAPSIESKVTEIVNQALSSIYRVKGSIETYSQLPEEPEIGDVYNIVGQVTLSEKTYPAGTNFVWTGKEWDALGGTINMSGYKTEAEIQALISNAINEYNQILGTLLGDINNNITTNSNNIQSLTTRVGTTETNISTNATNIATNAKKIEVHDTALESLSNTLTWQ